MIRASRALALAAMLGCASNTPGTDASASDAPTDVVAPGDAPSDAQGARDVPATPADVVLPDVVLEPDPDAGPPADALANLPAHASTRAGRFMTHDNCMSCHRAATGVLRDSAETDVSPTALWRTSMKAVSARDPYWLAVVEQELEATPPARATIENVCTRCHAPAGNILQSDAMSALHFSDVTSATTPAGHLAREGVTCTVCHQTTAQGLGTPESYLGNFVLNDRREIYGPHPNPTTTPMQNQVMYTPTAADHMTSAAFCASCHTVITRPLNAMGEVVGPEFNEQVTYLEWRNSDYRTEAPRGTSALSCQGCHMSTRDPNGMDISTRLSVVPPTLMPRTPIGRHTFVGANAYMLSLLAAERDWVGSASTPEELTRGAQNAEAQLRRAATLTVEGAARMGDALTFNVRVSNTTGHRFPTGYPSRRAWLHVRVLDAAGAVRFEVGRTNALGRFVNGAGTLLEAQRDVVRPHLRTITADDQVQVWESVMVDVDGRVTHLPLRAARYVKDNRILSRGWRADHADAARTAAVGVEGDADFRAGEDLVRFSLTTTGWAAARVEAELLFQSISPDALLAAGQRSLPAGARLRAMVDAHPPVPRVAATANATVR